MKKKPVRRHRRAPRRSPVLLPLLAPAPVVPTPPWANRAQDELAQAIGDPRRIEDPELVVMQEVYRRLDRELRSPAARVRVARYLLARFSDLPGAFP